MSLVRHQDLIEPLAAVQLLDQIQEEWLGICLMLATTDISEDSGRVIALLNAITSASSPQRTQLVARWREYMGEARASLQRQADLFEVLYQDAARNLGLQAIKELAAEVLQQRQEEAARIQPSIEFLCRNLDAHAHDPDLSVIFSEALEIVRGTLKNFDILRDRLLALASHHAGPNKVLRARMVASEIDHTALSREFMERFPNIRAALAK